MIQLQVLGSTDLRGGDGQALLSILSQPKRLTLLAYLALNATGGFVRRDKLLALFWEESESSKGRAALRKALSYLRQSLGEDVLVTRGAEEVGIAAGSLMCDAVLFEAALMAGDPESAWAHYQGPLLDSVHVSGAAALDRWLDLERRRLMLRAVEAATSLADDLSRQGDLRGALRLVRKGLALDPHSEPGIRRVVRLQARMGDREGAVRTYQAFVDRLDEELGVEPSAETQALGVSIRASPAAGSEPAQAHGGVVDEPSGGFGSTERLTGAPEPRESSVASTPFPRRAYGWAAVAGVVALAGTLLLEESSPPTVPAAGAFERAAIAVLPFDNLADRGPYAYFAGGLHNELLTQLSMVAALKVVSRTSVAGYTGNDMPSLRQIANELGVGTVMEGSVQVVAGTLRVHVQLIDAETDGHIWANTYDRALDDAFALQSDIAQQVVLAVDAALSSEERRRLASAPTEDPEAYRLFLQGREYETRPGSPRRDLEIAEDFYERALVLDPGFALARAWLSQVHGTMYWFRHDPLPARAARQRAEAEEALRTDPTLPQAHVAMGLAEYWGRNDYAKALDEFAVGLVGLPGDSWLWSMMGLVNRRLGRWEEARAAFERATQLSPQDVVAITSLAETLHFLRRYPDAVLTYDKVLSLAPDHHAAAVDRARRTYVLWQGQLDTLRFVLGGLPDGALGNRGTKVGQTIRLLHWERNADGLLMALSGLPDNGVLEEQDFFLPFSLFAAWAHRLRGDPAAAAEAFRAAQVLLDSVLTELADDRRVHFARGLALAGLGNREGALSEARWLQESTQYQADKYGGRASMHHRAQILAQAGEAEAALDEVERLLSGPSVFVSVQTLRLDPLWDPLRSHPRFQEVLAQHPRG